jgi:hypothetical protein
MKSEIPFSEIYIDTETGEQGSKNEILTNRANRLKAQSSMRTDNVFDEPVTMLDIILSNIFAEYTDHMIELLSQGLEIQGVMDKLWEFAESCRPEIEASLDFDLNPKASRVN